MIWIDRGRMRFFSIRGSRDSHWTHRLDARCDAGLSSSHAGRLQGDPAGDVHGRELSGHRG